MLRVFPLVWFFLLSLTSAAFAQPADAERFDIPGGWNGFIIRDAKGPDPERFVGCTAVGFYPNGIAAIVSQDIFNEWSFILVSTEWTSAETEEIVDFRYRFNGRGWAKGQALAPREGMLEFFTIDNSNFISAYRSGRQLEIDAYGVRTKIHLSGTTRMTNEVRKCVAGHLPEDFDIETAEPFKSLAYGTGVAISASGNILTNAHVVEECQSISARAPSYGELATELVALDEDNDLALLKLEKSLSEGGYASFRNSSDLHNGESIAVFGYPLAGTLSAGGNFVLGNITALSGIQNDERFVQISAPVQPGNSGGPLLDESGLLIGIVTMRIDDFSVIASTGTVPQNVNFAIKQGVALEFLNQNKIDFHQAEPEGELKPVEIAARASDFSAQIVCEMPDMKEKVAYLP